MKLQLWSLAGTALAVVTLSCPAHAAGPKDKLPAARVAGVSVKGLTAHLARQRLSRELQPKLAQKVVLSDGARKVRVSRKSLGLALDTAEMVAQVKAGKKAVPLRLTANPTAIQKALRGLAPKFRFGGKDARVVEQRGTVRVVPGQARRELNVGLSAQRIAQAVRKNSAALTLPVAVTKKPTAVTAASLKGINGRLGRYTTRFNPGQAKRSHNIRLAIRSIDGTILSPGEVFSLNQTVGERTQKRGYRTAPVFENRKTVPGIGGGVSQVTGTLFNAALVAGLPIVQYRTHFKPVPYVPVGRDATVAWNGFDMKFKNDTSAPVYVSYKASGSQLIATLYGAKKPRRAVSVTVRTQKKKKGEVTAQLYRTFKSKGKVLKKELVGTSNYNWNKPENPD